MIQKILLGVFVCTSFLIPNIAKTQTCPLETQKAYKSTQHSAIYYLTNTCTKRPFANESDFFTFFHSWNEVITDDSILYIADDTLGYMPKGPLYDPKF